MFGQFRQHLKGIVVVALALASLASTAHPQTLANGVRIVVPAPPGGTYDQLARLLAQYLVKDTGRSVVVENRSGGAQFVALQALNQSPADGQTLGIIAMGVLATSPVLPGMQAPVDVDRDLVPVVNAIDIPVLLVASNAAPFSTFEEFLGYARAHPGKVDLATTGNASMAHLAGARLAEEAKIKLEFVPYRGGQPAIQDVLAGNVQSLFSLLPETLGFVRSGKMQALGVAAAAPSPDLPQTPTIASTFPGFTASTQFGVVVRAGTSADMVSFWNRKINQFLQDPTIKEQLETRMLVRIIGGSAEDYVRQIQEERRTWASVITKAGIRAD